MLLREMKAELSEKRGLYRLLAQQTSYTREERARKVKLERDIERLERQIARRPSSRVAVKKGRPLVTDANSMSASQIADERFEEWLSRVDQIIGGLLEGLSHADFEDWEWRAAFDSAMDEASAVDEFGSTGDPLFQKAYQTMVAFNNRF